jgi:hypothetical protein
MFLTDSLILRGNFGPLGRYTAVLHQLHLFFLFLILTIYIITFFVLVQVLLLTWLLEALLG